MSLKYIVVRCFDNRMKEEPNLPLGKIFIPHLEYFISKNERFFRHRFRSCHCVKSFFVNKIETVFFSVLSSLNISASPSCVCFPVCVSKCKFLNGFFVVYHENPPHNLKKQKKTKKWNFETKLFSIGIYSFSYWNLH